METALKKWQEEYHILDNGIDSYERVILRLVDEREPFQALLSGYKGLIEEQTELRVKLRTYGAQEEESVKF